MIADATVIAVWGSPGSGKSTFSALLSRYLTRNKTKAIILSPDINTPMLPVWFPNENIENAMSICVHPGFLRSFDRRDIQKATRRGTGNGFVDHNDFVFENRGYPHFRQGKY